MTSKSPRGEFAGRKLKKKRQQFKWSDYNYIQRQLGLKRKADPLQGKAQASGIVLEKVGREEKKPNSGIRKCVRVQLKKNAKTITAFLPGDGSLNFVQEHDDVLVQGIGGARGRAKGDIPGVRWNVVKINGISLEAILKGKREKPTR